MFKSVLHVGAAAVCATVLVSEGASAGVEATQIKLGLDKNLAKDSLQNVLSLNLENNPETEKAFNQVYDQYLKDFDVDTYKSLMEDLEVGLKNYKNSNAYTAYKTIPGQPQCDKGVVSPFAQASLSATGVSPFPGGMIKRLFGFDMGKMMFELSQKAAGPAAASGGMVPILSMQALSMGASMIQSLVASAIHIIPPFIPLWNKPLTCAPMVTGHNCFGAILYPITMADFVIADVTDSMMDGYLSGFPTTYQQKVGKTSDAAYKLCAAAYMGMQCSSIFPRCNAVFSQDSPAPVMGRSPMCFEMCISTLVMCPGFWIEDVLGPCQMVSFAPACSLAVWWNFWRLPPQLVSFEDSHPAPMECPKTDASFNADSDYGLYDTGAGGNEPVASPFLDAASGATQSSGTVKLPNA